VWGGVGIGILEHKTGVIGRGEGKIGEGDGVGRRFFDTILLIKIKLTIEEAVQNYFDRDAIMIVEVSMVLIPMALNGDSFIS
jgi:hypothetical protein